MMDEKNNLPELPRGWVWTTIEGVLQSLESGGRPKGGVRNIKEGTPSIGGEHLLYNGNFNFAKIRYIPRKFYEKILRGKILKKDVLVVKDGATTGKTAFVSDSFPFREAAVNEHVFILRVSQEYTEPKYLFFWMQSPQGQNCVKENFQGTAQGGINSSFVKNSNFPLPPLIEQHRIVAGIEELFTRLDKGVEALKKAKAELKRYRQAVLKWAMEGKLTEEWRKTHKGEIEPASVLLERIREEQKKKAKRKLTHGVIARSESDEAISKDGIASPSARNDTIPPLPEGWVWTRVGELSASIQYGYTAKATDKKVGPKFLRITDIQNNNVLWDNVPYCEINELEKEKYLLDPSDLVFARTGATVGKSYLIGQNIPEAIFASYLIRIKLSPVMDKKFVYNFFQCQLYWEQINKSKIGIGQPNVNGNTLAKIYLPLPPLPEQHKIVEEIEQRLSVADEVEKTIDHSLTQAKRLRQAILKTAFEGKLVPQDPTDEPASVSLERIRLQKQQNEKDTRPRRKKVSG